MPWPSTDNEMKKKGGDDDDNGGNGNCGILLLVRVKK
jgi:hypothetical protein